MPSVATCFGCGKFTGCGGANPCDEDPPLYAERPNAATAMAKNPEASAQDRLRLICREMVGWSSSLVNYFTKLFGPEDVMGAFVAQETAWTRVVHIVCSQGFFHVDGSVSRVLERSSGNSARFARVT